MVSICLLFLKGSQCSFLSCGPGDFEEFYTETIYFNFLNNDSEDILIRVKQFNTNTLYPYNIQVIEGQSLKASSLSVNNRINFSYELENEKPTNVLYSGGINNITLEIMDVWQTVKYAELHISFTNHGRAMQVTKDTFWDSRQSFDYKKISSEGGYHDFGYEAIYYDSGHLYTATFSRAKIPLFASELRNFRLWNNSSKNIKVRVYKVVPMYGEEYYYRSPYPSWYSSSYGRLYNNDKILNEFQSLNEFQKIFWQTSASWEKDIDNGGVDTIFDSKLAYTGPYKIEIYDKGTKVKLFEDKVRYPLFDEEEILKYKDSKQPFEEGMRIRTKLEWYKKSEVPSRMRDISTISTYPHEFYASWEKDIDNGGVDTIFDSKLAYTGPYKIEIYDKGTKVKQNIEEIKSINMIKKTLKNFSLILFFTIQVMYCKPNPQKNPDIVKLDVKNDSPSDKLYNQKFIISANDLLIRGVKGVSEYYNENGFITEKEKELQVLTSLDNGTTWQTQNKFSFPKNASLNLTSTTTTFNFAFAANNKLFIGATRRGKRGATDVTLNYIFRTSTNVAYPNNEYLWDSLLYSPTNDISGFGGMAFDSKNNQTILSTQHSSSQVLRSQNSFFRVSKNEVNEFNNVTTKPNFSSNYYYTETESDMISTNPNRFFTSLAHNSYSFVAVGYQIPASIRNNIQDKLLTGVWNNDKDAQAINDYYFNNAKALMYQSSNGTEWNTLSVSILDKPLVEIKSIDRFTFLTDIAGRVFKSSDANYLAWKKVYEHNENNISFKKFAFDTDKNIYYAFGSTIGANPYIYIIKSTDKGETWTLYYSQKNSVDVDLTYHNGSVYFIGAEVLEGSKEGYTPFIKKFVSKM